MTERPGSDRTEYSVPSKAVLSKLNETAHQSIEDVLLLENQSLDSSLSYSYRDKTTRRKLETLHPEDDEAYEVVYVGQDGHIASVVLERASLVAQAVLAVDQFADGNVEEVAELSILRWVDGVEHPFITRYLLESFRGGAVLDTVSQTDIISAQGLEERRMTPYDYAELQKELQLVAVARAGLTDAALERG
jgi:hypothetical protein